MTSTSHDLNITGEYYTVTTHECANRNIKVQVRAESNTSPSKPSNGAKVYITSFEIVTTVSYGPGLPGFWLTFGVSPNQANKGCATYTPLTVCTVVHNFSRNQFPATVAVEVQSVFRRLVRATNFEIKISAVVEVEHKACNNFRITLEMLEEAASLWRRWVVKICGSARRGRTINGSPAPM